MASNGRKSGSQNDEKPKISGEDIVRKYLNTKNPKTRTHYKHGFELYEEFSGSSLYNLLIQVDEDRRRPMMERENPELSQLISFRDYLVREKKLAPKSIQVIFSGISDFFDFHGIHLQKKRLRLPKGIPKGANEKINIRIPEVRKMLAHCVSNRDKAIVSCLLQSGMSISDLLAMNVGDVLDGDSQTGSLDKPPLLLHKVRVKTGIKYRTCFGRDACNAVKRYLDERKRKYGKFSYSDSLFIKFRSRNKDKNKERLDVSSADMIFKKIVVRSGLVSPERLKAADLSPLRPHTMRMTFASILRENGCPSGLIRYFLGHKVPNDSAYFNYTDAQIRDIYKKYEKYLTIEVAPIMGEKEFGKKIEELDKTISVLKSQHESQLKSNQSVVYFIYFLLEKLWYLGEKYGEPDKELEKTLNTFVKKMGDRKLPEVSLDELLSYILLP